MERSHGSYGEGPEWADESKGEGVKGADRGRPRKSGRPTQIIGRINQIKRKHLIWALSYNYKQGSWNLGFNFQVDELERRRHMEEWPVSKTAFFAIGSLR